MNKRFEYEVAIVTGGARGIGREIARQLAAEGALVVLNDLDRDVLEAAAGRINAETAGQCIPYPGDAASVTEVRQLVTYTISHFGKLDIAVANAGMTLFGDFFEFTAEDFRQIVDLNLQGAYFLTQAAARQMRVQPNGGRILLMSSTIGQRAYPYLSAYTMTKAALSALARNLVLELAPHGITINALAPGATLTERTAMEDPNYAEVWRQLLPLRQVGLPEDMAAAALFLLSPEARHITGQTLTVDGGWSAAGVHPEVRLPSNSSHHQS